MTYPSTWHSILEFICTGLAVYSMLWTCIYAKRATLRLLCAARRAHHRGLARLEMFDQHQRNQQAAQRRTQKARVLTNY